jgi:hemerythrin-like domain-containing protein
MQLIKAIAQEHRTIERALDVFDRIARGLENGAPVPLADVTAALHFFDRFISQFHCPKTECVYFETLLASGASSAQPEDAGLSTLICCDHARQQVLLSGLHHLLSRFDEEPTARVEFARSARRYITFMRHHIAIADIFLQETEGFLAGKDDAKLEREMEEIGRDLIRDAERQQLSNLLDSLETKTTSYDVEPR